MTPDEQGIFYVLIIQGGAGAGEFVYDSGGNLRVAIVGATTTDPQQGLTCPSGQSFWNGKGAILLLISNEKDAIFQYFDNGSAVQGVLVFAAASVIGNDPVNGTAYKAGQNNIDPVFGASTNLVGATIDLFGISTTQQVRIHEQDGSGATSPSLQVFAPEQGQSGHLVMLMQGTSPDGTHLGQLLIARLGTGFGVPAPVTSAMIEFQSPTTGLADALLQLITAAGGAAGDNMLGLRVSGDTFNRLRVNADGTLKWGPGTGAQDSTLQRTSANLLQVLTADLDIATAGRGLQIKEGANAKQGTATLAGGTIVVNNTSVTANSRILLTAQDNNSTGSLRVSARTAGTSFTITSSNAADSGVVAWEIFEPG